MNFFCTLKEYLGLTLIPDYIRVYFWFQYQQWPETVVTVVKMIGETLNINPNTDHDHEKSDQDHMIVIDQGLETDTHLVIEDQDPGIDVGRTLKNDTGQDQMRGINIHK